jgi:hypothetical protein
MSAITYDVKERHDLLLAHKPSDVSHDASTCPLCEEGDGAHSLAQNDSPQGGGDMSTFTEEQVQQEIARATASIQAQLDEIVASQSQAAIDARFAEQAEAHEAEKAELMAQVDAAVAAAEAAQKAHDELVAFLAEEQQAAEAAAAYEARKAEVAEMIGDRFSAEYVEANIDRWASLDASAFEAQVADWEATAVALQEALKAAEKPATEKSEPVTAMTAGAETGEGGPDVASIRKDLGRNRQAVRSVGTRTY